MATNPRIPEQREPIHRGPVLVPKPEPPSSAGPGVALAIVTAVLLLGAILYFMPRAPKAGPAPSNAVTPAQPEAGQLAFSSLKMTAAAAGNTVSLDAQLTNNGATDVNGVMAEVVFPLSTGQKSSVHVPILGIATTRAQEPDRVNGDTEDLTTSPIKPGQTRAVRINVTQVPSNWTRELPEIRVAAVTGTTAQ